MLNNVASRDTASYFIANDFLPQTKNPTDRVQKRWFFSQQNTKNLLKYATMLQRLFIHLTLALLFAFTQIGVATHEISHFTDNAKHSQSDESSQQKSTVAEQCAQCISYAKIASGILPTALVITISQTTLSETLSQHTLFQPYSSSPYAARAPPQITSI